MTVKLPLYARSGIPWTWIVDPMRRLVEVFETVGGRPALTATAKQEERVKLPPFDIEFGVASWWIRSPNEEEGREREPP